MTKRAKHNIIGFWLGFGYRNKEKKMYLIMKIKNKAEMEMKALLGKKKKNYSFFEPVNSSKCSPCMIEALTGCDSQWGRPHAKRMG